jgi:hypothetical protein
MWFRDLSLVPSPWLFFLPVSFFFSGSWSSFFLNYGFLMSETNSQMARFRWNRWAMFLLRLILWVVCLEFLAKQRRGILMVNIQGSEWE